jgi:predicted TIM-barrel fold metal-dependent hydrolase
VDELASLKRASAYTVAANFAFDSRRLHRHNRRSVPLKLAQPLCGASILFACLSAASVNAVQDDIRPVADHHQHLYSPIIAPAAKIPPITARDLIALLDAAGIRRAAVLSQAYSFGNPNRTPPVQNERARVIEENDWTSREVAQFPDRLVGFCGVNPLRDYALDEITRCARDPHLRTGLKLHFANSDVDVENPQHVERLRAVFRAANEHRMAIVVHIRSTVSRQRPYGAAQARAFLDNVLPFAPDVVVQIAHLTGAGGYDDPKVDEALGVFVDAIAAGDPRMARVYFDVSGVAGVGEWRGKADRIATRIRQLGIARILYGSDGAVGPGRKPAEAWASFRELPLSREEFRAIAANVAPYLQ